MNTENRAYVPRSLYVAGLILALILIYPSTRRYTSDLGERWLHIGALSFALSFCLTPVCRFFAVRWDILRRSDTTTISPDATPLLGGVALYLAFLVSILVNGIYSEQLFAILGASAIVFGVGVMSDLEEVSAWIKLSFQALSAVVVISFGISLNVFPMAMGLPGEFLNMTLTLLWIVGITNAISFLHGMDGLAPGMGAIFSFFLGVVAIQTDQAFLGWVSISLMGACLGFLPHNFRYQKRASIFLGHSGTTVTGFLLACLAVYGDWSSDRPIVALASPLLIFWIPIFDIMYTSGKRIVAGKVSSPREWIEYVGEDHLHHRLALVLGGAKRAVVVLLLLCMCLGISAVALRYTRTVDCILLVAQAIMIALILILLERRRSIQVDNHKA